MRASNHDIIRALEVCTDDKLLRWERVGKTSTQFVTSDSRYGYSLGETLKVFGPYSVEEQQAKGRQPWEPLLEIKDTPLNSLRIMVTTIGLDEDGIWIDHDVEPGKIRELHGFIHSVDGSKHLPFYELTHAGQRVKHWLTQ